jgi:hypothetical protein
MAWLARSHPDLVPRYRELYRRGAYLPPDYRDMLRQRVAPLVARHRLGGDGRAGPGPPRDAKRGPPAGTAAPLQPTLF